MFVSLVIELTKQEQGEQGEQGMPSAQVSCDRWRLPYWLSSVTFGDIPNWILQ